MYHQRFAFLGRRVQIDVKSNRKPVSESVIKLLDETFINQLKEAEDIMKADALYRSMYSDHKQALRKKYVL